MTDIKRPYGDNDKSSDVIGKEEALEHLPKADDGIDGNAIPFRSAPGASEIHRSYPGRRFRASTIF